MAIVAKYAEQLPFVATTTQRDRVKAEAEKRRVSLAEVIRWAVDARYGLVDGEEPKPDEDVENTSS